MRIVVIIAGLNCRFRQRYWLGAKSTHLFTANDKGGVQFHKAGSLQDNNCSSAWLQINLWWKTQTEGNCSI